MCGEMKQMCAFKFCLKTRRKKETKEKNNHSGEKKNRNWQGYCLLQRRRELARERRDKRSERTDERKENIENADMPTEETMICFRSDWG